MLINWTMAKKVKITSNEVTCYYPKVFWDISVFTTSIQKAGKRICDKQVSDD